MDFTTVDFSTLDFTTLSDEDLTAAITFAKDKAKPLFLLASPTIDQANEAVALNASIKKAEAVAAEREVVITSDGVPKARLVPMSHKRERKVFTGTWEHLARMPKWNGGPTAEELVREDRDSRGW